MQETAIFLAVIVADMINQFLNHSKLNTL